MTTLGRISLSVFLSIAIITTPAEAATSLTQPVGPGLLSLTSPATASLPSAQTDAFSDHTSQGSLGEMLVSDSRGTYAGWSLTATISNLTQFGAPMASRSGSPTVSSSGVYTGTINGRYTISITTGGAPGTAKFQYSGLENDVPATVPVSGTINVGSKGLMLSFGTGTYQVGDSWTVDASLIAASNLTLLSTSLITDSGSPAGITLGATHQFSSTSDAATIMAATSGNGFGQYRTTPKLQVVVPARTPIGNYAGTLTETLN